MKKSKIKKAVKNSMKPYYKTGFTKTGDEVLQTILKNIDKLYTPKKK